MERMPAAGISATKKPARNYAPNCVPAAFLAFSSVI